MLKSWAARIFSDAPREADFTNGPAGRGDMDTVDTIPVAATLACGRCGSRTLVTPGRSIDLETLRIHLCARCWLRLTAWILDRLIPSPSSKGDPS